MLNQYHFGTKIQPSMALIVIMCLCLEHVRGSCLSYGHSCWGAHGKRASPAERNGEPFAGEGLPFRQQQPPDQTKPMPVAMSAAERWALVRVLPDKNAYKLLQTTPPLAAQFFFDHATTGPDASAVAVEQSSDDTAQRLAETSNDSSHQPNQVTSDEMDILPGDTISVSSRPLASIGHKRVHRRKKMPLSVADNLSRYAFDDKIEEDISNIDRMLAPTDEDIRQMLLFDAAVAAADPSNRAGPFISKRFSASARAPTSA
ncbi:uncharacterized protein LOC128273983 [Anopheles cruzii]|uniref:uncharacterized protein LOC128273983 n=1 Tax=Anopheles cruzii TaxID=68878 RepID=UPI0022EC7E45|nr:uncharacterized protein LOC128273983 [Anopheles cruzii]